METVQNAVASKVILNSLLSLHPGINLTADVTFRFPPTIGPAGGLIQSNGDGTTTWTLLSATSTTGPVPMNDTYHALGNQLINIDVINGVAGNTGGADTTAGTAIQSVTILVPPRHGTLSSTGTTGQFSYRPYPRFSGADQFYYTLIDASGTTAIRSAICTINVDTGPTAGYTGPTFLYGCTGSTNVILYSNGSETAFFTATFPGLSGTGVGIGSLATNREDNLIYYTSFGNTLGNLFAYDYANGDQFLVGNMTGANFSGQGSFVYNNSYLYYMARGTANTAMSGTILLNYAPGTTQGVRYVQPGNITGAITNPNISWDYQENNILFFGTGGVMRILNPLALTNNLRVGASYTGATNITVVASPNGMHYAVPIGTTGVYDLDLFLGTLGGTYPALSRNDINSMGEWMNTLTI